jgi:hypothetical protein
MMDYTDQHVTDHCVPVLGFKLHQVYLSIHGPCRIQSLDRTTRFLEGRYVRVVSTNLRAQIIFCSHHEIVTLYEYRMTGHRSRIR